MTLKVLKMYNASKHSCQNVVHAIYIHIWVCIRLIPCLCPAYPLCILFSASLNIFDNLIAIQMHAMDQNSLEKQKCIKHSSQ